MREGRFTASEIWKLFTDPKTKADKEAGKLSQTAETYVLEKAVETTTGYRQKFTSKEMEHGIINEPDAFQAFQSFSPLTWDYCPDRFFPIGENAGASPDAVCYDGLDVVAVCDLKCPQPMTFFSIKANDTIDEKYFYQLQMQMLSTGAKEAYLCYFLAPEFGNTYTGEIEAKFDLPLENRIHVIKIDRDEEVQKDMIERIAKAEERKQQLINKIYGKK